MALFPAQQPRVSGGCCCRHEENDTAKSLQCPSQAVAPALPDHDRADMQGCSGVEAAILTELSVHEFRLKARQGKDLLQSR